MEGLLAFVTKDASLNELRVLKDAIDTRVNTLQKEAYQRACYERLCKVFNRTFKPEFDSAHCRDGWTYSYFNVEGVTYRIDDRMEGDQGVVRSVGGENVWVMQWPWPSENMRRAVRVVVDPMMDHDRLCSVAVTETHKDYYYYKVDNWDPPLRLLQFVTYLIRSGYILPRRK